MNHDKINQKIQALESELAELKAELSKVNRFKFDYTNRKTSFIGTYCVTNNTSGSDPLNLETFRYRQTQANAAADFQLQKELMCIGALAEQIDPDYKTKLNFINRCPRYMVYYDCINESYTITYDTNCRALGVVYMPKAVAEKVCEILNNKQVEI